MADHVPAAPAVASQDVRAGVRALGLGGLPLCVHASLRSFGRVEGGAAAVVDALLAEGCTVLVPASAWSSYEVPPPEHPRPARNGTDHDPRWFPTAGVGRVYTPASPAIDRDWMGAIPAEVVSRPDRERGAHPLFSFAAVGPLAREMVAGQTPRDVNAPLRALAASGGWVLLVGVGLEVMTLLHAAEREAGRRPFLRWANGPDGRPMPVEVGGCSRAFPRFEPVLARLGRETRVGPSRWRAFPAAGALARAAEAIREEPEITRCAVPNCERCRDAEGAVQVGGRWYLLHRRHLKPEALAAELERAGFRVLWQGGEHGGDVICTRPEAAATDHRGGERQLDTPERDSHERPRPRTG